MAPQLPPLDLHAHVNPKTRPADLERLGAVVFAATRSLDEYETVRARRDQVTIWGVGCHPGVAQAQQDFDTERFTSLLTSTAFVSEIGLDGRSKVPLVDQEQVFASALSALQRTPRIASIHSSGASGRVLDALERTPIKGAVLHWWRGTEAETLRAIQLGCWFSINAAGMKYSADVSLIPLDRILTETDHPSGDRTSTLPRQPGSVGGVEQALAREYGIGAQDVRRRLWTNLARLVGETNVEDLLPAAVRRMITFARANGAPR
ncbi:TatD family deoxyribonuclease [Agromyces sp. CFH 90414]|uniref:TatD family deoxyribonuclease n=1 Tax=Agromyces agglutinans TaxID=2662258 RepID=A0A6I2F5Q3_9MICO|nr:TatD family hydrolase [Agromyces agglutinans]MRG59982.1 TatD family deoxyribonuclease [Agromyces agglutinans]